MGRHLHDLKALRDIALDYGAGAHPDLASMARELGRAIHSRSSSLGENLGYLRDQARGFERWLLAERAKLVAGRGLGHACPTVSAARPARCGALVIVRRARCPT